MAYCTLTSTEQIDELKTNPKISPLMYFKIPSDQPRITNKKYFTVKFLIYSPNHHKDMNKVSVLCSELLHF